MSWVKPPLRAAAALGQSEQFETSVSFQSQNADAAVPAGWTADNGLAFGTNGTYGWDCDMSGRLAILKDVPSNENSTHMRFSAATAVCNGLSNRWRMEGVPNGVYKVQALMGVRDSDAARAAINNRGCVANNYRFYFNPNTMGRIATATVFVKNNLFSLNAGFDKASCQGISWIKFTRLATESVLTSPDFTAWLPADQKAYLNQDLGNAQKNIPVGLVVVRPRNGFVRTTPDVWDKNYKFQTSKSSYAYSNKGLNSIQGQKAACRSQFLFDRYRSFLHTHTCVRTHAHAHARTRARMHAQHARMSCLQQHVHSRGRRKLVLGSQRAQSGRPVPRGTFALVFQIEFGLTVSL